MLRGDTVTVYRVVQDHVEEQAAAKHVQARQKEAEVEELGLDIEAELGIELGHDNDTDEDDDDSEATASRIQSRNISEVTTTKRPEAEAKEDDRQISKKVRLVWTLTRAVACCMISANIMHK